MKSTKRAGFTLIEVAVALVLFMILSLGILMSYMSGVEVTARSEEQANLTNAIQSQMAEARRVERESINTPLNGFTGVDAVINYYLQDGAAAANRAFDVNRLNNPGGTVGAVTIRTDFDGNGVFAELVDNGGNWDEGTAGGPRLVVSDGRYALTDGTDTNTINEFVVRITVTYRPRKGNTETRTTDLVLSRKEGAS